MKKTLIAVAAIAVVLVAWYAAKEYLALLSAQRDAALAREIRSIEGEQRRLHKENLALLDRITALNGAGKRPLDLAALSSKDPREMAPLYRMAAIDIRSGRLTTQGIRLLGLTPAEVSLGNEVIQKAVQKIKEAEASHVQSVQTDGGKTVVHVAGFPTESEAIANAMLSDLGGVWSPSALGNLNSGDLATMLNGVGAGYSDRTITVQPSTWRDGYFEVTEQFASTDGNPMSAKRQVAPAEFQTLYGALVGAAPH